MKLIEQSNHMKSQVKPIMAQSTDMQSMSKFVRKQIGTQAEVVRNSKHAVLPMHDLYVGQQALSQGSTSKHCYPAVSENLCSDSRRYKITTMQSVNPVKIQSNNMQLVKAELKKSQVNTKSQVQKKFKRGTKLQVKA